MQRFWSAARWVLPLVLLLGIANCNSLDTKVDQSTTIAELQYQCGPFFSEFGLGYQDLFLEWTPDGTQILFNYTVEGRPDINRHFRAAAWAVDSQGTWVRMLVDASHGNAPLYGLHADVSPDGARIVYGSCEFPTESISVEPYDSERKRIRYEIAVINLDGTGQQRLTENEHIDHYPVWSPDGSRIVFIANPRTPGNESGMELFIMAADGSDVRRVASTLIRESTATEGFYYWRTNWFYTSRGIEVGDSEEPWLGAVAMAPPVWSSDGERLAFLVYAGQSWPFRQLLYTVRADGSEMTKIAETAHMVEPGQSGTWVYIALGVPSWSPSGEYLAFVGVDEAGETSGVYTVRPDGTDLKQVLQPQGPDWNVFHVSWSPDGTEILVASQQGLHFIQPDGSGLRMVDEKAAFDAYDMTLGIAVAWSPDGGRIALYMPGSAYQYVSPQLYTIARDGTDRRDLIRLEDGNLAPANPTQQSE